ncbi:UNVERIFIED_CONTAM: Retrovirus-related Pol polyprotein from transposon TNT 1-94 [Sesamum radiatum]|uniref:Retrovirus-related Pol polyprotein from transposon TNT 1-94 n=1 Tax=Sesamum radiatum TaxID=300843 RepID=A0AAW2T506_SESRA
MGPQRRLEIYVGFESPSIIKYLEPMTGDQFTARYLDCQFDETIFPGLGGEDKEIKRKDIAWNATSMSFMDSRTNDSELEVKQIIHLQTPEVILTQSKASESQIRRKRGRPIGSKDVNPRKRKEHIVSINHNTNDTSEDKIPEAILSEDFKRNEQDLEDSYEMSINYAHNSLGWYRKEIEMNDIFAYSVASEIIDEDENDPQTIEECRHQNDWKSSKKAIQDELDSLNKREVFGPITPTPKGVKPVGYKWVFVRKRNEQNEVVRYKARFVAQGFTQKPGIDYTETYSPVVDATTLRFAIGALMYLANNTRPDIAFSVNLLARYSSTPTKRHWNGVKHVLRYLRGTSDIGLYFERHEDVKATNLVGYSDAGYLSDPHKAISQFGYVFMYGGTAISWRSTKQTLVATSSNHAELIALYEAGRECVWLRSLTHYVRESCGLELIEKSPTVIYEDNAACIAQIKDGYIKGDRTKNTYHQNFLHSRASSGRQS